MVYCNKKLYQLSTCLTLIVCLLEKEILSRIC